jgi:hypothetical protein
LRTHDSSRRDRLPACQCRRLEPNVEVPDWPPFMRGCIRYRQSLDEQLPDAPRTTGELDE